MIDSNEKQSNINKFLIILAVLFGSLNMIIGIFGILFSFFGNDFELISMFGLIFTVGIILLVSLCIIITDIFNYNTLLFVPILIGILTVIIGFYKIYGHGYISNDTLISYSRLIIGGMLLISTCILIFRNSNSKYMALIFIIFVLINIIIEVIALLDEYSLSRNFSFINFIFWGFENNYTEVVLTVIGIPSKIVAVIVSWLIIEFKNIYKFTIFIPILYGLNNILTSAVGMYIRIESPLFYSENIDAMSWGILIFGGFLLIILLFRLINKLGNKVILCIPIPFGIFSIILALHYILKKYFDIIDILIIFNILISGVLLIIISYKTIKKIENYEMEKKL